MRTESDGTGIGSPSCHILNALLSQLPLLERDGVYLGTVEQYESKVHIVK